MNYSFPPPTEEELLPFQERIQKLFPFPVRLKVDVENEWTFRVGIYDCAEHFSNWYGAFALEAHDHTAVSFDLWVHSQYRNKGIAGIFHELKELICRNRDM